MALSTPLFLTVMVLLMFNERVVGLTYLSPNGPGLAWSGTCPAALGACSTPATACSWPTGANLAVIVVGQCDIVLQPGGYGGNAVSWPLSVNIGGSLNSFQINGQVTGINLTIAGTTSFTLSSFNGQTSAQASLVSSSITLSSLAAIGSSAGVYPVSVSSLTLLDTVVTVSASSSQNGCSFPWTITDSNITVTSPTTSTTSNFALSSVYNSAPLAVKGVASSSPVSPVSLTLSRSSVSLSTDRNTTLLTHTSTATMSLASGTGVQATRLFGGSGSSLLSLSISSSSVSNFLELVDATTTNAMALTVTNSSLTGRSEAAATLSGFPLTSLPPIAASRLCTPSTISSGSSLTFLQMNWNAGPCSTSVSDSFLTNVESLFYGTSISFSNASFYRTADTFVTSPVTTLFSKFSATVTGNLTLQNNHPTVQPWIFDSSSTSSTATFLPSGLVNIDGISMQPSTRLKFSKLNFLKGSVSSSSSSSTLLGNDLPSDGSIQNTWTWGPIAISNATVDLSQTQALRILPASFPPSETNNIISTVNGGAIVSNNGAFLSALSVAWPSSADAPSDSIEWPMFSLENFTDPNGGQVFSLTVTDEDAYQFYARSETVGTTTTFLFHYGSPTTPSSCQGNLPPPFFCTHGLWKTNFAFRNTSFSLPAGPTTIGGDVTVTTTIIVAPGTSTLTVEGCLTTSEISLTIGSRINITQAANCESSLASATTSIRGNSPSNKKSCTKYNVGREENQTKTSLVLFVAVDNSQCNNKYIIAGSVVAGVAIIAIVTVAVIYTCTKKTVSNTSASRHMADSA